MIVRLACFAMGTRFELVLAGDDERRLRAAGEQALFEIEAADRQLSLFRSDSLLSHLNRCAAASPVHVDADTFELLSTCLEVHRASGGAFDPSVAPLMQALGFRGPRAEDPETARERVGLEAMQLEPTRHAVRFTRPDLQLDLGAIAKGHALDLAARALREVGVERALLHGGTSSTVALAGPPAAGAGPPAADAWHVVVSRQPGAPVARLAHAALGVSAPAGRTSEHDGEWVGHVLDPHSGASPRKLRHAAVITPDATRADAWSTALVAGASAHDAPADAELLIASEPTDSAAGLVWQHVAPRAGPSRVSFPEPVLEDTHP